MAEKGGDPGRLEGGGHGEKAQVGAQGGAGVEDEREGQVGVQVALMELVEDDEADTRQGRVGLHPAGEDALGHHLDPGGGPHLALVARCV